VHSVFQRKRFALVFLVTIVFDVQTRTKHAASFTDCRIFIFLTLVFSQIHKEIEGLVRNHSINSFQLYMAYKDDVMVGDHKLYQTSKRTAELGATVLVHAENGNLIEFVSSLCVSRCRLVANNNFSYHNQLCNSLDYS